MNADVKPVMDQELSAVILYPIRVYLRKEVVFCNFSEVP